MADPAKTKPRVLLSILKGEGFDALGDTADLFTSIIAGFGRFECERVLKPSGVELMNLAQSAIIEINVNRRSQSAGQGTMLYRGRFPLGSLGPHFFSKSSDSSGVEPMLWEGWLGLFSADVSLKGQSPERVFQQCLEMGNSAVRASPRLMLRVQYIQAGDSAPPRTNPSIPNSLPAGMEMSMVGRMPPAGMEMSMVGRMPQPQLSMEGRSPAAKAPGSNMLPGGRLPPPGTFPPTAGGPAFRSVAPGTSELSPTADNQGIPALPVRLNARNFSPNGGTAAIASRLEAAELRQGASFVVATPLEEAKRLLAARSSTAGSPQMVGSHPWQDDSSHWRAKCEELEKSLREQMEKNQVASGIALLEVENAELHQMMANLRLSKEELEQQNMRLHAQDIAREDMLKQFFEQIAPSLAGLGWPLRTAPAVWEEGASSAETVTAHLARVVSATQFAAETAALVARGGKVSSGPAADDTGLLGEAVCQAVEGGEESFEDWFTHKLDVTARARLAKATRLLSGCRQAAALRSVVATTGASAEDSLGGCSVIGPFYVPVKTDQVDLLLASTLLRLSTDPAVGSIVATTAAGLLRLEKGKYRLGPDGPKISCHMESGRIMVQVPSGNSNEANVAPVELSDFLTRRCVS